MNSKTGFSKLSETTTRAYCRKCKHARVPRRNMLCASCRRARPASQRTSIVPIWARILAVKEAQTFSANGNKTPYLTTVDMLAWAKVSMNSASGRQFENASNSADAWNSFIANKTNASSGEYVNA